VCSTFNTCGDRQVKLVRHRFQSTLSISSAASALASTIALCPGYRGQLRIIAEFAKRIVGIKAEVDINAIAQIMMSVDRPLKSVREIPMVLMIDALKNPLAEPPMSKQVR